jgi:hypothetical protein
MLQGKGLGSFPWLEGVMIFLDNLGHLISSNPRENYKELHDFAQSVGLRRSWFQEGEGRGRLPHPHYDVTGHGVRVVALKSGAIPIDAKMTVHIFRRDDEGLMFLASHGQIIRTDDGDDLEQRMRDDLARELADEHLLETIAAGAVFITRDTASRTVTFTATVPQDAWDRLHAKGRM